MICVPFLLYFSTPEFLLCVLSTISFNLHFVLSLITEWSISLYRYLLNYFLKSSYKAHIQLLTVNHTLEEI